MSHRHSRRTFFEIVTGATAALTAGGIARAAGEPESKQTYTYKNLDGCEIKADVFRASTEKNAPVVVWIHGGALIMGSRDGINAALRGRLRDAGYTVVSIDYRLAPETKLPAIIEDVQDACRWVRGEGPALFGIDPDRVAVMGASAGGYLTLMTGFQVKPRPRALVSFAGYGDIAGPWYSRPDAFYRRQPLVSKEEAEGAVGTTVIADGSRSNQRSRFYLYCRQNGLWPKAVTGHDPDAEPAAFDAFCPVRNVTAEYPPTLLVHGTNDTDVPYALSEAMDRELTSKHVSHELITIFEGGHVFQGVDPKRVNQIYDRVLAHLSACLGSKSARTE
jgi:acetyl esterase/lipase